MIDPVLIAAKTVASVKGDGAAVDIGNPANRVFLVTLEITRIIEQESLDISIVGSADGVTWAPKPLLSFPQQFYCGEIPLLLDLSQHPDIRFVRAHWEVARWGRGSETPMFEFGLHLKEVPADILRDVRGDAKVPPSQIAG